MDLPMVLLSYCNFKFLDLQTSNEVDGTIGVAVDVLPPPRQSSSQASHGMRSLG
jgi:hypothetical protein